MANINFYLRDKNAKKETPIILFLSADKKRYKFSTGEKILAKYWNEKKQITKPSFTGGIQLNTKLKKLGDEILEIYRQGQIDGIAISADFIKDKLKEKKDELSNKQVAFLEVLERFIEENSSTKSPRTIQTYLTLKYHLNGFREKTKYKLSFDSINLAFRDKFHRFLVEERHLNHTSVKKNFSVLKRFMGYATENGYNQSIEYYQFKFKAAPTTKISLTESELEKIEKLDLSEQPRLERVRDMFLFGCETSLRHGDLANVKPANIKTTRVDGEDVVYLDLIAQKTRGEIQAPLSKKAIALIEKYQDVKPKTCFPIISNQKFNSYIKEVGRLAGIDTPTEVIKFIGNQRITNQVPKYELISTHTQRRTFVTLHFEKGGSIASCMVYTGHKNYKELEIYRKKTLLHKLKVAKQPFEPKFKKVI